jgi:hypothetical protein
VAFYADIYGYIAQHDEAGIPPGVVGFINHEHPIFRPCFSPPVASRAMHYLSFACSVKLDEGEEGLWIAPFELLLKKINFFNAIVSVIHEQSGQMIIFSYQKDGLIRRFVSKVTEQYVDERVV